MLICGLFFGACAAVIGQKASTNTKGLILNGIIEFSPSGASTFYWVLTALSILFVLVAGWMIVTTLVHGVPDVVLTNEAISFPVGFPIKRPFRLPYAEITGLSQSVAVIGNAVGQMSEAVGQFAQVSSANTDKAIAALAKPKKMVREKGRITRIETES